VFIASDPVWEKKFIDAGLPLIGDDMRSQVGASVMSQVLQELAFDRGAVVKYHQQLNVGGNSDFNNMMVQDRLASKKKSKENVIRAQNDIRGIPVDDEALFAGPSTFIPYLKDNKVAYFKIELEGFGGAPIEIDAKLSVQDSENSAGVVIDAIRYLKVAQEEGIVGALRGPSCWTQKTPPQQMMYADAKAECEAFAVRDMGSLKAQNTFSTRKVEA
jgi:myo-inositol-1-phosphate synthase